MDERHQNILKKRVGILATVVIVLFALIGGLVVYNTPENRLARQLDLGERYLEEQNYAEAVLAFEKAIQIDDRCMAAYVNGIEAYRHLDESENLLSFYEKALEAARSLEGEALTTDMEAVVSIYLAAEDVYTDRDALITLWEEGYEKNGKDSRVQDNLVSVYLEQAEERASSGAYEESLQTYDRLLKLDGQDEAVRESLSESLKSYMDLLMEEGNFDRIRELEEKYASVIPNFDFEFYSNEILRSVYLKQAEEQASSGAYEESLQTYDRLLELDGQDEAVWESLTRSLKLYLDFLLETGNFDRIRELEEKYALVLPNFDIEFYSDEILRSQLELPFTPEDITIFGYKMIEDHFDDIVADLNLSLEHYYFGYDPRWHYVGGDDKSDIEDEVEDSGAKIIDVDLRQNMDSNTYEQGLWYSIKPQGQGTQLMLSDRGLNWLQDRYAGSYNLPFISCMGKKIDEWYQSFHIDLIKEIGEHHGDNSSVEYWVVDEPVQVAYYHYAEGAAEVRYEYSNFFLVISVRPNHEGVIDFMNLNYFRN